MIKKSFMGTSVQSSIAFTLLIATFILFCKLSYASEGLQPGMRYKIIRPIYLVGAFKSLNNRKLSRETARAYLEAERYAVKSEVAFQVEVSPGTNVTIVSSAKKIWHFPHMIDQYIVRLDPDLSRGLDVVLDLDRGLEGDLNGLNPELFARIEKME